MTVVPGFPPLNSKCSRLTMKVSDYNQMPTLAALMTLVNEKR